MVWNRPVVIHSVEVKVERHQENHYPQVLVVSLASRKVATSHPEGLAKDWKDEALIHPPPLPQFC